MFRKPITPPNFAQDPNFTDIRAYFDFKNTHAYAQDFGGMRSKMPLAIFYPPTIDVLKKFLVIANQYKIKMTVRGKGNSAYGQSQNKGGIIIDLKNMNTPLKYESDDHSSITVPAYKTWLDLTEFTKSNNKTVVVTPDNLDLTIGGTLSFATLGGTSYRCGSGADNVSSLDVLTLDGEFRRCSTTHDADLFHAALSGMGQFGIIINVTLPLVTAKKEATIHFLSYNNPSDFLREQKLLYQSESFDHLKGFVRKTDGQWEYVIEAASFHDGQEAQSAINDLNKLAPKKHECNTLPYFDFINMVTGFVQALRDGGKLNAPHPWYNILMPEHAIEAHLASVLDTDYLSGADPIIIYPMNSRHFKQPLFVKPEAETFYLLGVLYNTSFEATPSYPYLAVLDRNHELYENARNNGGCLYPVDATPLSKKEWAEHYKHRWDTAVALKDKFDPDRLLGSGMKIFEAEVKLARQIKMQ